FPPVAFGLVQHARDQIDIDLGETDRADEIIRPVDLLRPMSAAVDLEDMIVEVFNSKAEPRNADLLDDFELAFGQSAGFGFEGDLLGCAPGQEFSHGVCQTRELTGGNIRWRSTAEVDELRLSRSDQRLARVELQFVNRRVEIAFDF